MSEDDEWNGLNLAARANLRPGDLEAFFRYRDQLRREGRAWLNDARYSLAGWIWDTIEGYGESGQREPVSKTDELPAGVGRVY